MSTPPRKKRLLFQTHAEESLFDELIQLTLRTELITQLTGLRMTTADKEEMNARLQEIQALNPSPGAPEGPRVVTRPRGRGLSAGNSNLLQPASRRLEAILLLALHEAGRGRGTFSEPEAAQPWTEILRWRLTVYQEYLRLNRGRVQYSFEAYNVLIRGIQERTIELRTCTGCGAFQPVHQLMVGQLRCPLCDGVRLGARSRERVHQRLKALPSQAPGAARRA
jgi:hypothetical protein